MNKFKELEGSVILYSRGTFTEAKVYELESELFAKKGTGFIRLKSDGHTSIPNVSWSKLDVSFVVSDFGWLASPTNQKP